MKTWKNGTTDDLPDGPWKSEPDKAHWIDETTGLDCLIVRGPIGALCGYVGVPPYHPWHGKGYDDVDVSVHGGLTFAALCHPTEEDATEEYKAKMICHTPEPGRPDSVWWLGFDCSHCWDLAPGMMKYREEYGLSASGSSDVYRHWDYVQAEVTALAQQCAEGEAKGEKPCTT